MSPRQLVETVDIGSPSLSPGGDRVAFRVERPSIERNTYDTVWYVQRLDDGSLPVRVAEGGVPLRDSAGLPVPASAVWSGDGRWLYYRALIDGRIDVWRAATDGSGTTPLTLDPADVQAFQLLADDRLAYSVGPARAEVSAAEQGEYERGIRIDANAPTSQNLFRSGLTEGRLATQRLGFWFDRVPLLAHRPVQWVQMDPGSGEKQHLDAAPASQSTPALSELPKIWGEPFKVAREQNGRRVAFLARRSASEGGREIRLVAAQALSAAKPAVCDADLCTGQNITDLQWRPDHDEVVFTVTDAEAGMAQSIFRWNLETGTVHLVTRADGLLSGGRDERSACGVSADALVCVAAAAGTPPRLEHVDLTTGARRLLFDPNASLARAVAASGTPWLLQWADAEGNRFSGQFFPAKAKGDKPPPLFVTYYKCPGFQRGGYGDEWPLAALAAQGIAALCINAAPFQATAVDRYSTGLAAVEAAVALLGAKGEIDPARVGMGGLSFGTEVTMWTAMHSALLSAASTTSPMLSRTMYLHGSLKGQAFYEGLAGTWQSGAPEDTPAQWQALAPELNLERIDAPILMQMPEQEYLWALDYAIPLIREKRADVYAFPHEAHFKFQPRHLLAANQRNLDWFRFWLLGEEDADPDKHAQYEVWRSMRDAKALAATR
ncbi:dipeptidyl aminopeptidase [Lysobacteraceae bacterium NML93-0399]|nr:dipeptidyl aminopeptidase [Xanthomonadaceae bacterium NML93-0399]